MIYVITGALIIGAIGAVLAALLVLAEKRVANYGPCTIVVNDKREMTVEGGGSLLGALVDNEMFIPSACGGRGTCGFCKVKVTDGGGPVGPTEKPFLTDRELEQNIRLSCQVKVRGPVRLEVDPQLLQVRKYQATVEAIEDLTYDIKLFRFRLTDPAEIDFIAGQYVQLYTPRYKRGTGDVYRAYSIASNPEDRSMIELIIRRVPNGICTTWCFDHLGVGDEIQFTGPYGDFMLSETDADIVFVAGGSGMAPIVSMLHHMRNRSIDRNAKYFFGGNAVADIFNHELMAEFEKDLPNFEFIPTVANPGEDEWSGRTGLVTEAVGEVIDDTSACEGYLCGSPGMIDATVKVLTEKGMPEEKVYYDKFS